MSEPQSMCTELSERGNLGVVLLVRVDPRYTNAIQAIPAEKLCYPQKCIDLIGKKRKITTDMSEPQSKCTDLSDRGNLGVVLLLMVDPRHTNAYSGNSR